MSQNHKSDCFSLQLTHHQWLPITSRIKPIFYPRPARPLSLFPGLSPPWLPLLQRPRPPGYSSNSQTLYLPQDICMNRPSVWKAHPPYLHDTFLFFGSQLKDRPLRRPPSTTEQKYLHRTFFQTLFTLSNYLLCIFI